MRIVRFITFLVLVLLNLAPTRAVAEECRWEWRQECALQGEPPRMVCYWVPVRVCDGSARRDGGRLARFAALFGTEPRVTLIVEVRAGSDRATLHLVLPVSEAAAAVTRLKRVVAVTKITPAP